MRKTAFYIIAAVAMAVASCSNQEDTYTPVFQDATITSVVLNGSPVINGRVIEDMGTSQFSLEVYFSQDAIEDSVDWDIPLFGSGFSYQIERSDNHRCVIIQNYTALEAGREYVFNFPRGANFNLNITNSFQFTFRTKFSDTPQFPLVSDEELLTLVQDSTFNYFWDHAEEYSGMARETLLSPFRVSVSATGFGAAAFPVAVERGFIGRDEAAERLVKITDFLLGEDIDRFHGAYPGLMNISGERSGTDAAGNGADILSTAFLMQGLIAVGEYFDGSQATEETLRDNIRSIWEGIEWTWFCKDGEKQLYRYWSPSTGNHSEPVSGWSEGLIVYVLAASSPTYPIDKAVYDQGWAAGGAMLNGKEFYNITLPLGEDLGGQLKYAYYSFVGLNPQGLTDGYADYWEQNTAHARINHAYCAANPNGFFGYRPDSWGLTGGAPGEPYFVNSPSADKGVVMPSAALSVFPYTPDESMAALQFYYYTLGDKLFSRTGFVDSFSLSRQWFSNTYYGDNLGPVVAMIENHRTGLVWSLFMSNEDILSGLAELGITHGLQR